MPSPRLPSLRFFGPLAVILPVLCSAGCSGDVNPMKQAFIGAGYGPKTITAPDFVETSRRPGGTYMPVGKDEPRRATRARSSEAQKTLEADLEGARTRNEARGKTAEGAGKDIAKGLKPAAPPPE